MAAATGLALLNRQRPQGGTRKLCRGLVRGVDGVSSLPHEGRRPGDRVAARQWQHDPGMAHFRPVRRARPEPIKASRSIGQGLATATGRGSTIWTRKRRAGCGRGVRELGSSDRPWWGTASAPWSRCTGAPSSDPRLAHRLIGGTNYQARALDAVIGAGPAIPGVGDVMRYPVSPLAASARAQRQPQAVRAGEVSESGKAIPDANGAQAVANPRDRCRSGGDGARRCRLSKRYGELSLPLRSLPGRGIASSMRATKAPGFMRSSRIANGMLRARGTWASYRRGGREQDITG